MTWKRRLLKKSRLYAILDKDICSRRLLTIAKKIIDSGVDIIQLRYKNGSTKEILRYAKILRKLSQNKSLFIVNDHIDAALACSADGLHLGQEDMPIELARRIVGDKILIGVSCHNLEQAKLAQKQGADYIGIGPIFPTATKIKEPAIGLKVLKQIKKNIKIPFFAIGGIDLKNLRQILDFDVKTIAVARAICQSSNINWTITRFKALLK